MRPKIAGRLRTAYEKIRLSGMAKVAEHLELTIGATGGGSYMYDPGPDGPVWTLESEK